MTKLFFTFLGLFAIEAHGLRSGDEVEEMVAATGSLPDPVDWHAATAGLRTGDLIMFSGAGAMSALIKRGTRADYSHVGLVTIMKFNANHASWEVVLEQDPDTLLCVAEVANHDMEDVVTADKHHGFQVVPLLPKVGKEGDYDGVTFFPLKAPLNEANLAKLQQIYGCLHAIRTRYEKGANVLKLVGSVIHTNSGEDLSSMFCSDFVAYVGFEMGWLDIGTLRTSKNVAPGDFVQGLGAAAWELGGAFPKVLDMATAVDANSFYAPRQHQAFANEAHAASYFLKRNLQYENEVLKCGDPQTNSPTWLQFLHESHPGAYDKFLTSYWGEIRAQRLWDGVVNYTNRWGRHKTKYFRLAAQIDTDNTKHAAIYHGAPKDAWKPNQALKLHRLLLGHHEYRMTVSQVSEERSLYKFDIALEEGTRNGQRDRSFEFEVKKGADIGLYFSSMISQLREWTSAPVSRTRLESAHRMVWLYPAAEIDAMEELNVPVEWFTHPTSGQRVAHARFAPDTPPVPVVTISSDA